MRRAWWPGQGRSKSRHGHLIASARGMNGICYPCCPPAGWGSTEPAVPGTPPLYLEVHQPDGGALSQLCLAPPPIPRGPSAGWGSTEPAVPGTTPPCLEVHQPDGGALSQLCLVPHKVRLGQVPREEEVPACLGILHKLLARRFFHAWVRQNMGKEKRPVSAMTTFSPSWR